MKPKKGRDPRSPAEKAASVALARAHRLSGDPEVIAAAEREHRAAYFERRVQQLVAQAPPLL